MKKMRKLLAGLMASLTLVSALPAAAAASPLDVISSSGIVYAAGNGLLSIPMYVLTSNPNNRLILRAGASTSSAIVGYLSYGTKVTVHRVTTSGWAKVTANGKTGYVSARYLTASNPNAAASTTIMFVKTSRPGSNLNKNISPMLAKLIRVDPAIMASPLISTIMDSVSMLLYFNIARAFLNV